MSCPKERRSNQHVRRSKHTEGNVPGKRRLKCSIDPTNENNELDTPPREKKHKNMTETKVEREFRHTPIKRSITPQQPAAPKPQDIVERKKPVETITAVTSDLDQYGARIFVNGKFLTKGDTVVEKNETDNEHYEEDNFFSGKPKDQYGAFMFISGEIVSDISQISTSETANTKAEVRETNEKECSGRLKDSFGAFMYKDGSFIRT